MTIPRILDQIPWEELEVGTRVRSRASGRFGKIVKLDPIIRTINIDWDNSNEFEMVWHFWLDHIEEVL